MGFEPAEKKVTISEKQALKVQGLRAGMMAIDRAMGKSIAEIAEAYHVAPSTVKTYLTAAEEEGFVDHYRKAMYDKLAGKALAVYEAHLDQGSLPAAKDVAFGLGILRTTTPKPKEKPITTLEAWREEKEKEDA